MTVRAQIHAPTVAMAVALTALLPTGCKTDRPEGGFKAAGPGRDGGATPRRVARPQRPKPLGEPVQWDGKTSLRRVAENEIWVFANGRRWVLTQNEARRRGFTVIDLSDAWTPILFSEQSVGDPKPIHFPYRKRYLDLANDRTDRHGRKLRKGRSNHLELYGIPPTPSVLRKRLQDTRLRKCYEKVDRGALKAYRRSISAWGFRWALRKARAARANADKYKRRRKMRRDEDLARTKTGKRLLRRLRKAEARGDAARAALRVLRCERLLTTRRRRGTPAGDEIYAALTKYERKHMVVGRGALTRAIAQRMARSPDEADADALKRVLRERVIHAAGIVEDGSARHLKKDYIANGRRHEMTDLVSKFTDVAVRSLGLAKPAAVRGFLLGLPAPILRDLRVAVRLPPRPAYHSDDMDLEVVINRGDVYYDPPMNKAGKKRSQYRGRTPRLTLYVLYNKQRIPLVRWRTTVGGWRDEVKDGHVYLKYKASDIGRRVWRDVIAAPIWIPPPTTPPKEIVRGKKVKTDNMGPGYLSAYGLVAALHLIPRRGKKETRYWDKGIRTHGSYNYRSIRAGYSHGCHRLYNHKALRMFSFLLRHRPHARVGLEPYHYNHPFEYKGRKYRIKVNNRGYVYRFTDPVPVVVTRGRVLGKRKRPLKTYLKKPGVEYPVDAGAPQATSADGGVPKPKSSPDAGVPAPRSP